MAQVRYPSFENIHRVITSRKIAPLENCYVASEKIDGANAGVCISLHQQKILWIQSRGRGSGPAPLIWTEDFDQPLLKASISGNVLAGKDPELYTKLIATSLHLADIYSISSEHLTIFGEAKSGSFYPFAFGVAVSPITEDGTSPDPPAEVSESSPDEMTDDTDSTINDLFGQLSFRLHGLFIEHGLTPPRLMSDEPQSILRIVSLAEPELIREKGQAEFEGWFITHNVDDLVVRSEVKGYKLKSTTHEEQPAVPFDFSALAADSPDVIVETDSSEERESRLAVAEKLIRIFSHKGQGLFKAAKASPVKHNAELNHQIQLAFDSVMSKQQQSVAEIRSGDKSLILETLKRLNPLVVEDVNSQFTTVGLATPNPKMLSSMVGKFLSFAFFAPPKGP